jgi:hypothetical protein
LAYMTAPGLNTGYYSSPSRAQTTRVTIGEPFQPYVAFSNQILTPELPAHLQLTTAVALTWMLRVGPSTGSRFYQVFVLWDNGVGARASYGTCPQQRSLNHLNQNNEKERLSHPLPTSQSFRASSTA